MNTFQTLQWSSKRKISFVIHAAYAFLTITAGMFAALVLWQTWFDSWLIASLVITTIEALCIISLVLHISRIEWPLAFLRHALPYLAIVPLGWELYRLLSANPNNPEYIAIGVSVGLTGWFVYLEHRILESLERLFIDPVEAAREQAKEEMGRTAVALAKFQETRNAAESFARSILPAPPTIIDQAPALSRRFDPIPLLLEETPLTMSELRITVDNGADPRFVALVSLACRKNADGSWMYTPEELKTQTRADMGLILVVCKMMRSGQLVLPSTMPNGESS